MADYKVSVGNVEIISLSDGTGDFPAADVFPKVSSAEWDKYPGTVSAEGKLNTNFGCFALRSQGQTILVDTGLGPSFPGRLLEELKGKGVDLSEIAVVAITHLHPDHVGWNLVQDGGKAHLTFPRARYWIPKGDWDHFRQPQVLAQASHVANQVVPLEQLGALNLVEGETTVTSEVTMVPTPGHTPGHMSVAIASQGELGFILGDVANFPFQAQETSWEMSFDNDSDHARRTREAVLERLERDGSLVGAGHFMPPSFGRFVRAEGRRYWRGI
ncbi:MAG: MBL fold metallo-hydrolase [Dehalococcoidia bacterium]